MSQSTKSIAGAVVEGVYTAHTSAPQPCKPRAHSTPVNRLPPPVRPGAMDAAALPRVELGWRVWPDGRRERA